MFRSLLAILSTSLLLGSPADAGYLIRKVSGAGGGGGSLFDEATVDAPVAGWRFDETSGTTATDAFGSYDLTYQGSYTLNQTGLIDSNASVDFGGGRAQRDNAGLDLSGGDATWEFVVQLDAAATQSNWAGLIVLGSTSNSWAMQRNSSSGNLDIHNSGATRSFDGAFAAIADGTTKHVVLTWDNTASLYELWINGVSQGTQSGGGAPGYNASHHLKIASSRDDITVQGIFDEVYIYNTKLSNTRIATHFAATGL